MHPASPSLSDDCVEVTRQGVALRVRGVRYALADARYIDWNHDAAHTLHSAAITFEQDGVTACVRLDAAQARVVKDALFGPPRRPRVDLQ